MSATSSCAHHACKNAVNVEEFYHTCSLCRTPAYCSEECRVMDWPTHGCPNVTVCASDVAGARPMLRPYYYEDYLTEAELAELPVNDPIFQERAFLFASDNRNVSYYIEANAVSENGRMPEARGREPSALGQGSYELSLSFANAGFSDVARTATLSGKIPHDMIFAGNTHNKLANAIAGGKGIGVKKAFQSLRRRLYAKNESYIFWPSHAAVKSKFATVNLPPNGDVTISLNMGGKTVSHLAAGYELQKTRDGFARNLGRSIREKLRQALKLKFEGTTVDTKKLQVLSYADNEGNGVLLTFHVDGGRNELVDVEYMANNRQVEGTVGSPVGAQLAARPAGDEEAAGVNVHVDQIYDDRFACDARNLEDMVALSMALDTYLSNCEQQQVASFKQLEQYAGVIKNHTHSLAAGGGEGGGVGPTISPQVSVAINAAMDALYADVGASAATWRSYSTTELQNKAQMFLKKYGRGAFKGIKKRIFQREANVIIAELDRRLYSMQPGSDSYRYVASLRDQMQQQFALQ